MVHFDYMYIWYYMIGIDVSFEIELYYSFRCGEGIWEDVGILWKKVEYVYTKRVKVKLLIHLTEI